MNIEWIRSGLILLVFVAIMLSGRRRQPGIGIIVGLLVAALVAWLDPSGLGQFGLVRPQSWLLTIGLALAAGLTLALFSLMVIEPLAERLTGEPHDLSIVDGVKGSLVGFLQWVAIVWVFVALPEEFLFRGYLQTEVARALGGSVAADWVGLVIASTVFGIAHMYQGRSGGISTAIVGLLLGGIFLLADYNLWLVILIHGIFDTVQIGLIALDLDGRLRTALIDPPAAAG